jgi:hypothetical protein
MPLTSEEGLGGEVGVVGLSQGLGDVQEFQATQGVALQQEKGPRAVAAMAGGISASDGSGGHNMPEMLV